MMGGNRLIARVREARLVLLNFADTPAARPP